MPSPDLTGDFDAAWSVQVVDAVTGEILFEHDPDVLLSTASVGKVFLLAEVAHRVMVGRVDPAEFLDRRTITGVGGSGLWQHLRANWLPVADVAALVGAVSDNLATNVLIDTVGLPAVQARAAAMTMRGSTVHDVIRDVRGPDHPPRFSSGCAADLTGVFAGWHAQRMRGNGMAVMVLDWLAGNVDTSLVSSAFGVDPLEHARPDMGVQVWSKTGSDTGVRAEAGLVLGPGRAVAFAAVCNWDPVADQAGRAPVLASMRSVGARVRENTTATP